MNEILADIPVPDGFDSAELEANTELGDRYAIAAEITDAVQCAWITQWVDGKQAGDLAAADEANAAMQTSTDWAHIERDRR